MNTSEYIGTAASPPDSPGMGAEGADGEGSAVAEEKAPGTMGTVVGGGGNLVCSHASCSGVNGSAGASASGSNISTAEDGDRGKSAGEKSPYQYSCRDQAANVPTGKLTSHSRVV